MAISISLFFPQKRSRTFTLTATLFFFSLLLLILVVLLLTTTTTNNDTNVLHLSLPPTDLFSPALTSLFPPPPPPQPLTSLIFETLPSGSQVTFSEDTDYGQPPGSAVSSFVDAHKGSNGGISTVDENGDSGPALDTAMSSDLGAEVKEDDDKKEQAVGISVLDEKRDHGHAPNSEVSPVVEPGVEGAQDRGGETPVGDEGGRGDGDIGMVNEVKRDAETCDLYMGKWVRDEEYPVYTPGFCPYVDEAFDCQSNGRPDSEYLKWRWKPDGCTLPRFNSIDFLRRLRGKRLMLVGDSMNRNQFESLSCLLREGLPDKSKMFETHGYKITKGRGYYIFKFVDYDCTVEFVRSHFLVKEGIRINGQGKSNPTLAIDRIDKTAARWKKADILIFNTGHWWTHGKTARGKNYYKEGDYIYPQFDAVEAYRRALSTWGKWIDNNVKPRKKLVFYRGYSSAHFRGGDWDSGGSCNGEREPISGGAFLDNYPLKMKIVEEVIQKMKVPVILLNVTRLTNFRKDGHPSIYGKNRTSGVKVSTRRQDCSHWCLPGVPDAWNELIYATLVSQQSQKIL